MHKKIVALTLLATLLAGSPGLIFAFGLGEIEINSALNQPMNADIDLVGFNAATIDEVKVELASQQMFERVGVPRPYILTRLKFTPMISNGKPVIRVTSTDAIREPFLTFLIDVRWAKGKLLREYTVLLDPPVFGEKAKATIQAPKVATQPVPAAPVAKKPVTPSRSVAETPAPSVPKPSVRPNQAAVPSTASKPVPLKKTDSRPVRRGDTLWSIAEPYARDSGVSVNQMMLAIQEANPQSFAKNNINNLKSGIVLRIPAEEAPKYSAREALAEVQRQWQVWKQGTQTDSGAAVNVDAGDVVDGEVMATPEPGQEQPKSTDSSLSILGDGDVAGGKAGDDANATLTELRNQVSLLKENAASKGQENTELKGRIESLESMIKKQENIISLQNEQLAQLQNTLATEGPEEASELAVTTEDAVDTTTEAALASEEQQAAETGSSTGEGIKPATVEPLPDFSEPIPEEFLAAETDQPESLVAEAEVAPEAVAEVAPVETVSEVSFFDNIKTALQDQGKTLLYAGGALIVLLLGWLGLKRRNANDNESSLEANGLPAFEDEPSVDEMLDETVIATPDNVDDALEDLEPVDEENKPEENVFADEDSSSDSDDVLAEADVYISYGLYQQAEELLKDGLAKEPENVKYQVKLAEIYYADKKSDEFVQHVETMESGMNKQSPEWAKIASMGAALMPAHALFADAGESSSSAVVSNEQAVTEDDSGTDDISDFSIPVEDIEDFDSDDLDDNSLDFTFGDDGELSDGESETSEDSSDDKTETFAAELDDDMLEESSTAILEAGLDFESDASTEDDSNDDETLAFDRDEANSANESSDSNDVFLDFDGDELESDLNAAVSHDGETEMLDHSLLTGSDANLDLDDAINLDEDLNADSTSADNKVDNDLDDLLDDNSETAMFDMSSLEEHQDASDEDGVERTDEDTVSLEQVQENLTAELETLSFDADDIDPESMEEDSLPTLQTSELGKPDLDIDDMNEDLTASETGTFERDMLAEDVTEQFDVGNIDSTMTDLGEFGDDYELDNPSVIEEVGTKLDLAKAFVDMGDEDAAKETLTEVMEQGDSVQIQQAKDLLDKLN